MAVGCDEQPDYATRSSAASRVQAFLDGRDRVPDWIGTAYGLDRDGARHKAATLRRTRQRLHRARDRVAEAYSDVADSVLGHLERRSRPVIQLESRLAKLAAAVDAQRADIGARARLREARLRDDEPDRRPPGDDAKRLVVDDCIELIERIETLAPPGVIEWPTLVWTIRADGEATIGDLQSLRNALARLAADIDVAAV